MEKPGIVPVSGGDVNKNELMTWYGACTLQVSGESGDVKEMLLLR